MLFLWYPTCSTCQKARAFLDEHHVAYTVRHIKDERPTVKELAQWSACGGLPLKRFFNTAGLSYRTLALKNKLPTMAEDEQLSLLAADGMLVKRPILVCDDFVLTGFRPDAWSLALNR